MPLLGVSLLAGASLQAASETTLNSPYGICSHVSRGELQAAPATYEVLKAANIRQVRTDFDWRTVETSEGNWDFSSFDAMVEQATRDGIDILPILDYDVIWARPAWKHLDKWNEYVQRTVSRYADTLRYWEVWNEQNVQGFWRDTPNGENYAKLLKRTYETIKQIDPELTVLYGGTAGVPLDFIEDSLKAGAGEYFDVMSIHPYQWQGNPELLISEIEALQALMQKYGVGDKPIWITEIGWSTAQAPAFYQQLYRTALERADIDPKSITAAVLSDPRLGYQGAINFQPVMNPPLFGKVEQVTFADLKNIDAKRYPVLIPTVGETFPSAYMPELVAYLKQGGTLLLPSGLPFFYDLEFDGQGGSTKQKVEGKFISSLHIGWETWWTRKGVPRHATWQKLAPEFADAFEVDLRPSGRFLIAENLADGDELIPILESGTDDYKGAVVALYKLNSDLKGNVIVSTPMTAGETTSEEQQAEMLPRTYLVSTSSGVERVYWYNFRAKEWDDGAREAHFGIVHQDLAPKPAYFAYETLTRLCPNGSRLSPLKTQAGVFSLSWTRPDGVNVSAVWTSFGSQPVTLDIEGELLEAVNHLGQPESISESGQYSASPSILYLVGPTSVTVR